MLSQFSFRSGSLFACGVHDLTTDPDFLIKNNISIVYILLEKDDIDLKIEKYLATIYRKANIIIKRFPIQDFGLPISMAKYNAVIENILIDIKSKNNVLVHCHGGTGRTGLIVVGLFTRLLKSAKSAYKLVTEKRPALDTKEQRNYIVQYEKWLENN